MNAAALASVSRARDTDAPAVSGEGRGMPAWLAPRARLGFGLGLRREHYEDIIARGSSAEWFEAIAENFMDCGGKPLHYLEQVRRNYPVVLHGVSGSIGSTDALDHGYLRGLAALIDRIEPAWVSDHLCWTGVGGINTHDLLPLPYTEEALVHVVRRIQQVQDYLRQRILIENVSSYLDFHASSMPEWEFLDEVARRADCLLLLDVNNIYVSARNHGFDPRRYLDAITPSRVRQIHLAGHSDYGTHVIDTHDAPICAAVWELYHHAIRRCGAVATMIERDDEIPPLAVLEAELDLARTHALGAHLEAVA